MSTFFGGPQLQQVINISGSGSTTFTAYTVPAGFNAHVKVDMMISSGAPASEYSAIAINGQSVAATATAFNSCSVDTFLSSGSSVGFFEYGNTVWSYHIGIQLYKNP